MLERTHGNQATVTPREAAWIAELCKAIRPAETVEGFACRVKADGNGNSTTYFHMDFKDANGKSLWRTDGRLEIHKGDALIMQLKPVEAPLSQTIREALWPVRRTIPHPAVRQNRPAIMAMLWEAELPEELGTGRVGSEFRLSPEATRAILCYLDVAAPLMGSVV